MYSACVIKMWFLIKFLLFNFIFFITIITMKSSVIFSVNFFFNEKPIWFCKCPINNGTRLAVYKTPVFIIIISIIYIFLSSGQKKIRSKKPSR